MKKCVILISLFSLSCFIFSFSPKPARILSFAWAIISPNKNGEPETIDSSPPVISMENGDRIKFYLKPIEQTFIYLFLVDTQNNLHLLFPESTGFFDTDYRQGNPYLIPEGTTWFRLDEPEGTEYFYLIGSPERLSELESLSAAYISLCDTAGEENPVKQENAREAVIEIIRSIQKETSPLAEGGEKFIPISGSFRTIEEVAGSPAVLVQSKDIYVRTIRIRH